MSLHARTPPDITRSTAIELLPGGWHALEYDSSHTFRWVDNAASFSLPPALNPVARVQLELEAGPGMGRQFFQLTVRGDSPDQVFFIRDRHFLTLTLPLSPSRPSRYSLNADGGGLPCPNDDRQLNFRVFLLATTPDIVTLQSGLELLCGWDPLDAPTPCCLARSGSSLRLHAHRDFPVFCLDIDPGPPLSSAGLRIDLLDAAGDPVATTAIQARQVIGMRIPVRTAASRELSLYLEWIGQPSAPPPLLKVFSLSLN